MKLSVFKRWKFNSLCIRSHWPLGGTGVRCEITQGRECLFLVEWLRKAIYGRGRHRFLELGNRLWHLLFPLSGALFLGSSPAGPSSFSSQLQWQLLREAPDNHHHVKVSPSQCFSDLFFSQPSAYLKCLSVYSPASYLPMPVEWELLENRVPASSSSANILCLEQHS